MSVPMAVATLNRTIDVLLRSTASHPQYPRARMSPASLRVDQPALGRWGRWTAPALDWVFPKFCVLCDIPGQTLCALCRADSTRRVAVACRCCAIPLYAVDASRLCGRCLKRRPAFDTTIAAATYEAPFDVLVRGLKYGARLAHAPLLADLLLHRIRSRPIDPHRFEPDLLVAVPLSRDRMAARGFNQSIESARPLARSLKKPLATSCVLRTRDTPPQAALPFDARRKNMRRAFAVSDSARSSLKGLTIAVVDDVMTTGATLDELAATLKRAGAARVVNLVVARTP
jgi:ComF family protein